MSRSKGIYAIHPVLAADQLDLVYRVHGIEQAEKFFNRLEDYLVDYPVYIALLKCYVEVKYHGQAESTMNCIRKFNSPSALPYTMMLSLYCSCRQYEKLDALVQEMQEKGILHDKVTYSILLKAYACFDVEKMEKTLMEMESDYRVSVYFHSYAKVAKGYIKADAFEKAYELLKKSERKIGDYRRIDAYLSLIDCYATMQKKEDVYRVLNMFPDFAELSNCVYNAMIKSLVKLDDLEPAKKILELWEETNLSFDIRIPNLVIRGCCEKGDVREAEIIVKRLVDSGRKLNAQTFKHMALGYAINGEMEKAVEMKKKAIRKCKAPDLIVAEACLEYLQSKGDGDGMREFLMLLEKFSSSSDYVKEIMERFSSNDGKPPKTGRDVQGFYVPLFTAGRI